MNKQATFNPVKADVDGERARRVIWSTQALDAAIVGLNAGRRLVANPFYENNTKLLKEELVFERTPEENEYFEKCLNDILLFASQCQLMTPEGIQPVILRDYQIEYLKHLTENRLSIFLSCRQSGKTTTSAMYMLWYALFNTDKNLLVTGNKYKTAKEILNKIKEIFYQLPYYLKPGIRKWNEAEIVFDNGCRIMAEATTVNSGISFTYHCILCDEFAHLPKNIQEPFYNNIFPTITAAKAHFIVSSTQNGHNLFYKLYQGAVEGINDYAPFKVDWPQVPEWNPEHRCWEARDESWKTKQIGNLGSEEAFQMQFGTNFEITGSTLISKLIIKKIRSHSELFVEKEMPGVLESQSFRWMPSIDIMDLKKEFLIFTVDLSESKGQDFTVLSIYRLVRDGIQKRNNLEFIGCYENNKAKIETFAQITVDFILKYTTSERCMLSFESNLYGYLYTKCINEYAANNSIPWDDYIFCRIPKATGKGFDLGLRMSSSVKAEACALFKMMLENGTIINSYSRFILQMENFCDSTGTGKYRATYGHDDIMMTGIQLAYITKYLQYKYICDDFEESLANSLHTESEYIDYFSFNNYTDNKLTRLR